jgi:polysaccharide transporter, PST family
MILGNAALVYVAQACRLAIPILMLPVVARTLDIDQFAALSTGQALAYLIMILPEYGFAQAGPRTLAALRGDVESTRREASRILLAKMMLCIVAVAVGLLAAFLQPVLQDETALIFTTVWLGLALGMVPAWYFQGVGDAKRYAMLDIAALIGFLGLVLLVPFGSRNGALVLMMQAGTLTCAVLIGHAMMLRSSGFAMPAFADCLAPIRSGFALFLNKLASNGPGLGLLYIIGFLLPAPMVAHYAAAERLLMGSANALWPIMQILMPEIAERRSRDAAGADRLLLRGLGALCAVGLMLMLLFLQFAEPIIALLFGPGFEATGPALQVLALALPMIAISNALGNGVLVAEGRDWTLALLTFGAALLSAGLAIALITPDHFARVAQIRFAVEAASATAMIIAAFWILRTRPAPLQTA